ncbi:MAG TPA: hypothetical protein VEP90_26905, partial [Methylomirabilota bacterium]|nr:hypothetical protein [Methylomirabilota bacterium]
VGRWRNNIGRVFGQFGVFPLWSVNQTLRSLSRGSLPYITGVIARRAAMQGMLYGLSQSSGLNLSNWYFWHGFGWRGGPIASGASQVGQNVFNLLYSPFSDDQDAGQKALKRMAPLAVQDWYDAIDQENDYTTTQRVGRGLGIKAPVQ